MRMDPCAFVNTESSVLTFSFKPLAMRIDTENVHPITFEKRKYPEGGGFQKLHKNNTLHGQRIKLIKLLQFVN